MRDGIWEKIIRRPDFRLQTEDSGFKGLRRHRRYISWPSRPKLKSAQLLSSGSTARSGNRRRERTHSTQKFIVGNHSTSGFHMDKYKGELQLLMVEDNTTDAELCLQELRSVGFSLSADVVETPSAFAEQLDGHSYDVILADYRIPGWSGMEALTLLKQTGKDIPFIVVTGSLGDEAAVQCIKAGASDYILKDRLARLPQAIFHLMEERKLRQASKLAEQTVARQALELQKARERRFQMKAEFLDHVSHELRTPIAAACMFLTNTLDGLAGSLRPEQQDWLGKTLANLRELHRMVDELLAITQLSLADQTFAPVNISFAELAYQACSSLRDAAHQKNIQLIVEIASDLPPVYADSKYIQQILSILIGNALKAMDREGRITIGGEVSDLDRHFVRVSVADSGRGLDAEALSTVFERLYQPHSAAYSSRQGLGIGLHVCEELVARHTGRIWVESQPDQGTTFFFTLPASEIGPSQSA
jgi:signal transduction histidine kinase